MSARTPRGASAQVAAQLQDAMAWLHAHSSRATRDGMARYAIPSDSALGVAMKDIKALGKTLGRNHALALALWDTGVYEARMLTSFVGDPTMLTPAQMDRWCKQFDNWAFCDALSFNLFDRSPHAWTMVHRWSARTPEFEKRTAFALLWSSSLHNKIAPDERFIDGLALIEGAATDERNFVKKAVLMSLRAIIKRNRLLKAAGTRVARTLAASEDRTSQWIGKQALRP